jgi:hypothetical protein
MQLQQLNNQQWQGKGQNTGQRYAQQNQWTGGQQQTQWNRDSNGVPTNIENNLDW